MRIGHRKVLVAILLLAAFLRLAWLGAGDVISDEALYGFRSVGYVDYLAAPDQPTTWERLAWPVPWWAYLSFHDHPPLTFLAQHFSFRLFGVNAFALRLPSALAGVVSVWLAYLIARRLWDERAGLLAAALFAVAMPLVWISRLGLQEALVIFWGLLAVYGYVRVGGVGSREYEAGDRIDPSDVSPPREPACRTGREGIKGRSAEVRRIDDGRPPPNLPLMRGRGRSDYPLRVGGAGSTEHGAGDRVVPLTPNPSPSRDPVIRRGRDGGRLGPGEGGGDRPKRSHTPYSLLHTSGHPDTRWYLLVGLALGLGLLTKYTSLAVALALLVHLLWFRRPHLRSAWLWWGGGVFLLCSLPVVVYNLMLFGATGHFDLQLSFLLGQDVAEWRSLPGKAQIGSLGQRLVSFATNLGGSFSVPLLAGLLAGLVVVGWQLSRRRDERNTLVILLVAVWGAMLLAIGPSTRFLAPLAAWLVLAAAGALASAFQRSVTARAGLAAIVVAVVAGEALFSANTVLAVRPVGAAGLTYAPKLRTDIERWGYQQLDAYLDRTLAGRRPALTPDVTLPFLKVLQARAAQAADRHGDAVTPLLIVYDANLYNLGALWILHRRLIYDGWPAVTADRYLSQPPSAWRQSGVRQVLFIRLGRGMLGEPPSRQSDAADRLAASEAVNLAAREQIASPKLGTPAFMLYQWSLK